MKRLITRGQPQKLKTFADIHWHRRWMILRMIKIGGAGTPTPDGRRVFVVIGRLWSRHSHFRGWLYCRTNPIKVTKDATKWLEASSTAPLCSFTTAPDTASVATHFER